MRPEETDLIERCIRRSLGAWEELLGRYRDGMRRSAGITLQRVVGSASEDDVEAVVESVLVALVKDNFAVLRAFAGRSSLQGYLNAITTRIALNHLRTERRKGWLRLRPLEAAFDAPSPEPETPSDPEKLARLRKALEQLPPRDQLILKLFHLDGAGYKEIAGLMGLSINAVSPALIRARQKIRALMEGDR
jgi:RNA polymerase sigma-70 factor, ECF subfamily